MFKLRTTRLLAVGATALVLAACGSDADDATSTSADAASAPTDAPATTAGTPATTGAPTATTDAHDHDGHDHDEDHDGHDHDDHEHDEEDHDHDGHDHDEDDHDHGEEEHAEDGHDHGDEAAGDADAASPVEIAGNRVVTTYDGGLLVLEGPSLELVADLALDGFNRVNPAGDDRHVLVSHGDEFRVLDAGVQAEAHGDHFHYYGYEPELAELDFPAPLAGHVTHHHGITALFSDGTGDITLFDPYDLITGDVDTTGVASEAAHHGVAVQLGDGQLFATLGTEDERPGARVLDADGEELARSEDCPGVHGESTAAPTEGGGVVAAGCADGVLVWADGGFTKIESPDELGAVGTLKGTDTSPIVLGDYEVDADTGAEGPARVSLIDTRNATIQLVELDAGYSWRSLVRDHDDNAMVLTTDGELTVIDVDTGEITAEIPVVGPWEVPAEWQQPRPAIVVDGASAYVTDPATDSIHRVDLEADEVVATAELPATPNEITTP